MELDIFYCKRPSVESPKHTPDEITCKDGCSEIYKLVKDSRDGTIDTGRGRITVKNNGASLVRNGDHYCLKVIARLPNAQSTSSLFAHSLK